MMNQSSRYLAENIINFRNKLGLTQQRLADLSGATRASIALLESGSSNPTLEVLLKISGALQVSINELLSAPYADCTLIKNADVPVHKKSRKGGIIRKILPDKTGSAEIDELTLEAGSMMPGTPHVEGTKEYFTCISGQFTIAVMKEIFVLEEGDVLAFPGDKPHSYKNSGKGSARGFSVVLFKGR